MYRIVGADGRQYGPVAPEQIRQWLAERRVNAETLAQAEGSADWRALATYADFMGEFQQPPHLAWAPPRLGSGYTSDPRASNKLAAGICGILLGTFGVHKFILGYTGAGLIMLLVSLLSCFVAAPVIAIIGLIEGIVYLTKSDAEFVRIYVEGKKEWF